MKYVYYFTIKVKRKKEERRENKNNIEIFNKIKKRKLSRLHKNEGDEKITLTLALNSLNGQYGTEYNLLMEGSLISMIPIIIVYICAQKYFKEGLMAGGVKG